MKKVKTGNPMQTRHGRPNWKAYSVVQLQEQIEKNSSPKVKHKIRQELNRKVNNAPKA
jgi:hypothetical protein